MQQPIYKMQLPPHQFYIPVMGLAFTIDSPLKVAKFGISSAISIMEDRLIETMRKYYYNAIEEPFIPIPTKQGNSRENRITDYLNLINRVVNNQIDKIKKSIFEAGSDLVKYFEMLPNKSDLSMLYSYMQASNDTLEKEGLKQILKANVRAGSIDVNIMTKVDKDNYTKDGAVIEDSSDAVSALRGYAKSDLTNSTIIFSAGLNPRLFNYLEKCRQFDAKAPGKFDKKIALKVSDYRSALIQGKYLAKKGVWVSEFRIESGLNCGGHAFVGDGNLIGPTLEEFKSKRSELCATLFDLYNKALAAKSCPTYQTPHPIKITYQGGIATNKEHLFVQNHYGLDAAGWGTPFLLVPEATTVDLPTLTLLQKAQKSSIQISPNSPLGVPFYYLKGTSSDLEKHSRITQKRPGSPCTERHLVNNTEFTKLPICTASVKYQQLKLNQLKSLHLPSQEYETAKKSIMDKECLCIGLSNAAPIQYQQPFLNNLTAVAICPGPNIIYFSKVVSLQQMVGHIYGKTNIITEVNRPHFFINELYIYIEYLRNQVKELQSPDKKRKKFIQHFYMQIQEAITYYRKKATIINDYNESQIAAFIIQLDIAAAELTQSIKHCGPSMPSTSSVLQA
ncbi:hypothetical protein [Arachidicoccus rhizosphaerae]|nr:hypothetical protein [Arachidicoccus rhizosphaerae]